MVVSCMTPLDLAKVFLRKAREDLTALSRLAPDFDVADEIFASTPSSRSRSP